MSKQQVKQVLDSSGIDFSDQVYFNKWVNNWDGRPTCYDDSWEMDQGYCVRLKKCTWLLKSAGSRLECKCMCLGKDPKVIDSNKESLINFLDEVKNHSCAPWPG